MKLIKLYSNMPKQFRIVRFREGLNVVMGTIKNPDRSERDTHNLGKTLFGQVIDFCLLKGRNANFFLFKHEQFADFVFFLEVRTHKGEYITIRRSVSEASKGSFKRHVEPNQDYSDLPDREWDHWQLPFEKSKEWLDGALDLTVLDSWSFREAVSYSLRSQKDYDEPFKLAKFAGPHADWKPFLSHLLGFDGHLVADGYAIEKELGTLISDEKQLLARASGIEDVDQLRGQIRIIEKDVHSLSEELEQFDFAPGDERATRSLVADIDAAIVQLNEIRYSLQSDKSRIEDALGTRLSINLKSLEKLFKESEVYFSDQVKKDYEALEKFNRELAEERDTYLQQDLEEIESQLRDTSRELEDLNSRRATALASLTDAKSISKYKRLSKELVARQTDLESLKRMEGLHKEIEAKRKEIRDRQSRLEVVRSSLESSIESPPSRYETIRGYLDEIVFNVIDRHANLFSRVNKEGHLEFSVEVLDEKGKPSSAGDGFSYGRLLCVAFDLAIMRAYLDEPFPHFVFHDGLLETLDDRKKVNLIEVSREYCKLGIQHVITVIDSEMPSKTNNKPFQFETDEIILSLSDVGNNGRLFKMPAW